MKDLDFYTVSNNYIAYLKSEELKKRGFSRVPNMDYGKSRKPKFLCGIVLEVNTLCYFVPVSSYKQKKPDNFLICDKNDNVVSSLRFNYMFPVPLNLLKQRNIDSEHNFKYKALLSQELTYCVANQDEIRRLAHRTYKRVLLGKDKGLVTNSCDFRLLEEKCLEYQTKSNSNAITHDYAYAKIEPEQVKDLQLAEIDFEARPADDGKIIVRYNAGDKDRVEQLLAAPPSSGLKLK